MVGKPEYPAAQAGANRVDVTVRNGNDDAHRGNGTRREQQARHLLNLYAIPLPLALVIAEHAFDPGRRRA